ncbi:phosphonate metabolism transcriptional regulator PhnF [Salipiger sp. PrR002]|uniref:phosphonate metabolism transcriptional regulator PhnF n=1 Tax=Salipiger sp. PrR002 TaxID=2706489 RepID=UPI0013B97C4E|nr:phosphonate metabolism transcriptional regulator PhnF [Salipiger sp. PrR002]NDV97784.1 phosphonate metabolism transcriptional regulator PhnF [Salipiger sp. PrR002]NDW55275.1 phosphonate metabolism transcriptional regulator PhnF [Salipiger sp. PrR004]
MPRSPVWQTIATTLEDEIARGHYRAGDKLPTEAELATRFAVNRHTVRHALSALAERGLTHSRRGAGVFVRAAPLDYPIGGHTRFSQNVRASGRLPDRRTLRMEIRPADAAEAEALQLATGAPVLVHEGISLAGGAPVAHFISYFPITRLPGLDATLRETRSVTEALRRHGIADYTRASTRLTAEAASATQARHLNLREGEPLLRSVALNLGPDGIPVEQGHTWFAGDRVALTVSHEETAAPRSTDAAPRHAGDTDIR